MSKPVTAQISPGVLSTAQVKALFATGRITSQKFDAPDIDSSAFDLRLSGEAWSLCEGQRPATRELATILSQADKLPLLHDRNGDHFNFDTGKIYLVKLAQYLALPSNVSGRATGKSSIGRLDVITRLLTNNCREYDIVEPGYEGPLYLLVIPQTFPIVVKPGQSLNQLRLFSGPPHCALITRDVIGHYGAPFWFQPKGSDRNEFESWDETVSQLSISTADPNTFDLTVDLSDNTCPYIYKAKDDTRTPIDLRSPAKSHDPKSFFEQVDISTSPGTSSVVLDRDGFYIMKSRERLSIPCDVAVEVVAISERIGDIRIHYAGFAHPGFGLNHNGARRGTPLIFEVRATDMPTRLYDGSLLARIQFFRMSEKTEAGVSPYNDQELKLSNFFGEWS